MSRIGGRRFLYAWQMLKAASQPGPQATAWRVGDVEWRRSRHSITTPDYVTTLDIHRLDYHHGGTSWSVMVVAESWWDERQTLIRSQVWATHLAGDRNAISRWMDGQATALPRVGLMSSTEAEE
jgi:hypothetical protein